jgi:hypothetical protein
MTTVYEAIMAAADHIERTPDAYGFFFGDIPKSRDCRACALAWIGFFMGLSGEALDVARAIGCPSSTFEGSEEIVFYNRMNNLSNASWCCHSSRCVATLRLYASAYHTPVFTGPRTFTGMPDSVRQIFEVETA